MLRPSATFFRRLALLALMFSIAFWAQAAGKPALSALWLAQKYTGGVNVSQYWVSEKYDGVRGYWDGQALWTRQGEPIAAPAWFTAGWPNTAVEGELWAGRGQFSRAQSTTRKTIPVDAEWRTLRFMLFDAPGAPGTFDNRLVVITQFAQAVHQP